MGRIGFYLPPERPRRPIYSISGRKLCYMEANRVTQLDGTLIAIILRYKEGVEPEVTQNCISTTALPEEPEQQYEV